MIEVNARVIVPSSISNGWHNVLIFSGVPFVPFRYFHITIGGGTRDGRIYDNALSAYLITEDAGTTLHIRFIGFV